MNVKATQSSLSSSMMILEENSEGWKEPLQGLEDSLTEMEDEVRLYKGLAIGGMTITVVLGVSLGLVVLFNSLGML